MKKSYQIISGILALSMFCTAFTGCSGNDLQTDSFVPTERPVEILTSETAQEEEENAMNKPEMKPVAETSLPETEHISPTETVTSVLGTQIDVDAVLNRDSVEDSGKNYSMPLSRFIEDGDLVTSFTFIFYSADGKSSIGTYKGGCGISVTQDCPSATNKGWYQSDDFSVQADGAYVEVTWNVPAEIQNFIPKSGTVQIGYWWGDTTEVRLQNVICNYSRKAEIPVDNTENIAVGQNLNYSSDSTNTISIPLADVLGNDGTPQAVTFEIASESALGKFTGAFGMNGNEWYMSDTVAVFTDASNLSLTWIIPEEVKNTLSESPELLFSYWWGKPENIVLQSVTIKYSTGRAFYTLEQEQEPSEPLDEEALKADREKASALVANIKVGWNLGNSLDSYDKRSGTDEDYETLWGNAKTTQTLIDTIKKKGFNAVRIPVSWTNHLDENGNVDGLWMERVQEVVDYAMHDELYVILNMHHDDFTWLTPTKDAETEVTEKYVKVWSQIAEQFQDYDEHLLFEGLNEPRVIGSPNEWTGGTAEERTVINHLLQKFVDTVRSSGGYNPNRTLVITTHAASISDSALDGLRLPNDGNVVLSIHNYAPYKLTTDEFPDVRSFDDAGKYELKQEFDKLYEKFVSRGIPVIIGEFGAEDKDNATVRSAYYAYYVSQAKERNIPCFVWDNGAKDSYGLLDRNSCTWYYGNIADAVINAANS